MESLGTEVESKRIFSYKKEMIVQDGFDCLVLFNIRMSRGAWHPLFVKGWGVIMFGFLIALLSGALMSIQGVFNTQVTKSSTIWVANAFVQCTALLVCLGAWLITDRSSFGALFKVQPKYMLLGGAIGAFITYTVIKAMEMLGPAKSVMLIVVAQLIVAYVIELFGLFGVEKQPLEVRKLTGMGIAILGIIIFKWT